MNRYEAKRLKPETQRSSASRIVKRESELIDTMKTDMTRNFGIYKKTQPMKTVAIIGTRGYPSYYGGFETAIRHLAPYLCDQGWKVRVYSRKSEINLDDPEKDPRVQVITTPYVKSKSLQTLSHGLSAVLHAVIFPPDVVLVMNVANGFWIPLLRARGIPVATNVDGIEWLRGKWGPLAKWVFLMGARLAKKFSTSLIFDAKEIARWWLSEFHAKGQVIEYGARPPIVGELKPLANLPGVNPGEFVLYVARFVPENSILEFLDAAKSMAAAGIDVVIVGDDGKTGPISGTVRRATRELPHIHWIGRVSDDHLLQWLWVNCGVYYHGHSVGGTNPALVQAMWCQCAIVARDTVFNREVLQDSAIFADATAKQIQEAVQLLLADRSRRDLLARSARRRAESHYSLERINGLYEQHLRALIQKG